MSSSFIAPARSKSEIIKSADKLRERFNLANNLYFPIVEFAEIVLQKIDDEYSFEVCEKHEMIDKYAQYNPISKVMTVRQDVYTQAIEGDGRARFTIAHEVAHYMLHSSGLALARGNCEIKIYQDPEWQANVFASELLMPSYLIENMSAVDVAIQCQTSYQAAQIALSNVKKIS